jgi:ankyrin repeat protein
MNNFYLDSGDIPDFFCQPKNFHLPCVIQNTFPLHMACAYGGVEDVVELIRLGVNVNSLADMGQIAINEAILRKNIEMVRILLENGARLDIENEFNQKPIDYALRVGDQEIMQLISSWRVVDSNFEIDDLLVRYQEYEDFNQEIINLNSENVLGEFPVHIAIKNQSIADLRGIIKSGGDLNLPTNDGLSLTPLHYAIGTCQLEMVQLLIENGANVEIKDSFHRTPLYMAFLIGETKQLFYLMAWIENSKAKK